MVNNFLSEKGLQEKFKPKWAECFIHVMITILLVAVGFNKFFFSAYFPSLGSQSAD
jgi:uncharacterized membrane protein